MSEEAKKQKSQRERILIQPPKLGVIGAQSPHDIVADFMRNVADAANQAGLQGNQLIGLMFDNQHSPLPRVELIFEAAEEPLTPPEIAAIEQAIRDGEASAVISLQDYTSKGLDGIRADDPRGFGVFPITREKP